MITCDVCFGAGYVFDESRPECAIAETCPKCKGSGNIEGEYPDEFCAQKGVKK